MPARHCLSSAPMSLGPMGHEFVPMASQADADDFIKDHKGKRIYSFERISNGLPDRIDAGKFD